MPKAAHNKGRWDCNLCPEDTRGQPTMLFYATVLRAHAAHFDPAVTDSGEILRNLAAITGRMGRAA